MECAGSTEAGATGTGRRRDPAAFDPDLPYELHPDVALRPEPFGALAYHYGNRRLTFLRSRELVGVVRSLAEHDSASAALGAAGIEPGRRGALEAALASLASSEVIRAR